MNWPSMKLSRLTFDFRLTYTFSYFNFTSSCKPLKFQNSIFKNVKIQYCTTQIQPNEFNLQNNIFFHPTCNQITKTELKYSFTVVKDFINENEESALLEEVEPHLRRLKYEFDHWDDAIHGFRETEKLKWSNKCTPILNKLKENSFKNASELLPQVHVLDLASDGVIKPHVDSVRFCGNIISGLCLLSDAIMRLIKEDEKDQIADVFLPQRSLYIMRDESRYKYTHEILPKDESYFQDKFVARGRRISIICRNHPV